MDEQRARVLVGEDHPVYREGVVRALRAYVAVVADVADGVQALAGVRQLRPDVAVLDYRMPGLDGRQVARAIRREELPTRVLILTALDDSALVYGALQDGVSGYLIKEAEPYEITEAVLACARDETVRPRSLTSDLIHETRQRADHMSPALSAREHQVLRMIAEGKSVPQISKEIFLAPTTIKSHVQRIYEKLGVSTRGAVVAEAMRRGLLE
ncbi:response regulator [Streptomyces silvisoli]|uniref:Response regulator transcription factor n=1 Tax=Streptomyces silvisoli TaxID=3034235 RepID=A0ABT5ZDY3_9ACTN|nr:response regulator transcription factor [Streptomyces silvisoli]MDF3288050.1 response regulator transcription factor [Streptomyces silvisoli]